jgi:hypothetical protein
MKVKFFDLAILQRLFPELQNLEVSNGERPTRRQVEALRRFQISARGLDSVTADALTAFFEFRAARRMSTIPQVSRLDFAGCKDAAGLSSKAAVAAITALPEEEAP